MTAAGAQVATEAQAAVVRLAQLRRLAGTFAGQDPHSQGEREKVERAIVALEQVLGLAPGAPLPFCRAAAADGAGDQDEGEPLPAAWAGDVDDDPDRAMRDERRARGRRRRGLVPWQPPSRRRRPRTAHALASGGDRA